MALPIPESPSVWRDLPRLSMKRLWAWTLPRRYHETMAVFGKQSLSPYFSSAKGRVETEYGEPGDHSSVTNTQLSVLLDAIEMSEGVEGPIIEIGSFRGKSTAAMAGATSRQVVAVDPYIGEGGHPKDLAFFEEHTQGLANVTLLRMASDQGFGDWGGKPISGVFIDAIHEYPHALYDFAAWSSLVSEGGFAAFHDVDEFAGVNRVCLRVLREAPEWEPWGLAPNLAVFRRRE